MGTDDHARKNQTGAPAANVASDFPSLTGSESQVEWAERIKRAVSSEFDRVETSFRAVAETQDGAKRERTASAVGGQRIAIAYRRWHGRTG